MASQLGGEEALAAMAPHELAAKMLGAAIPAFLPGLEDDGEASGGPGSGSGSGTGDADETLGFGGAIDITRV